MATRMPLGQTRQIMFLSVLGQSRIQFDPYVFQQLPCRAQKPKISRASVAVSPKE